MRDYGTTNVSGLGVVMVTSILVGGSLAMAGDGEGASPTRRSIAWPRPPALTQPPDPAAPLGLRLKAPGSATITPSAKVAGDAKAAAPVSASPQSQPVRPIPKSSDSGPRRYQRYPRNGRNQGIPKPAGMVAWIQPRPMIATAVAPGAEAMDGGQSDIASEPINQASGLAAAGPIAPQISPAEALQQARMLYASEILKPNLSGMNFTFVLDLLDAAIAQDTLGGVARVARRERERVATTAAVARRYQNAMHEIARVLDD